MGRLVKATRSERGWSLRRLADEAGVSASLLSAVENGKIVPSVSSLFSISDALGRPAESFFPQRRRPALGDVAPAPTAGDPTAVHPDSAVSTTAADATVPSERRRDIPSDADRLRMRARGDQRPATAAAIRPVDQRGALGIDSPMIPASHGLSSPTPLRRPREIRRHARPKVIARSRGTSHVTPPTGADASAVPRNPSDAHASVAQDGPPLAVPAGAVTSAAPTGRTAVAGVTIRPVAARPRMDLDNGVSWSLVTGPPGTKPTVIEVSMAPSTTRDGRYRSHDYPVEIIVIRGTLMIEAAFARTVLGEGDAATINTGVPHRFLALADAPIRFLVVPDGQWDGTV